MKVAVFFALVALASAGQIYNGPGVGGVIGGGLVGGGLGYGGGIVNTGSSSSSRKEDGLGNYHFNYQEQGATGGSARDEAGSGGRVTGSYSLNVGDGRQRTVNYVADEFGYRAQIQTNEPGTAPLAGADTTISAPDSVGIAAATNHRAAKQLEALANAPPAIEQQYVAAPRIAIAQPQIIQQAPIIRQAPIIQQAPLIQQSYAARVPVAYSSSIAHVAAPAIASSVYGAGLGGHGVGLGGYSAGLGGYGAGLGVYGAGLGGYGAGLGGYGAGLGYGSAGLGLGYGAGYGPRIIQAAPAIGYNPLPAYRAAAVSGVKGAW